MAIKGLDKLDSLGRDIAEEFTEATKNSIESIANRLVKLLQQNAPDNSGNLQSSISALPIEQTSNGWVLKISMEDYGIYQDAGVKGTESGTSLGQALGYGRDFAYTDKMPPTNFSTIGGQSLGQWADANNVSKFAVAKSIFKRGLRATKWASNTIDSPEVDKLINDIATLIVKDFS